MVNFDPIVIIITYCSW